MNDNKRRLETAALLAMAVAVLLSVVRFDARCRSVEDEVLRLHVIANSDSADDQALKLAVRDAVLRKGGEWFASCASKADAQALVKPRLNDLRQVAEAVVRDHGYSYPVQVTLSPCRFPTRTYGDVTLPAGTYDAVRVILGAGEGQNWWCVMFPPLCLPAAGDAATLADVLAAPALQTVKENPKYELRFWVVEKLRALKNGA